MCARKQREREKWGELEERVACVCVCMCLCVSVCASVRLCVRASVVFCTKTDGHEDGEDKVETYQLARAKGCKEE